MFISDNLWPPTGSVSIHGAYILLQSHTHWPYQQQVLHKETEKRFNLFSHLLWLHL